MQKPTPQDKELIIQLYCQTCNEAIYWNEMGNEKVFEISKQLLGAAVIAVPLTGAIVTEGTRDGHLFSGIGWPLGIALAFVLISIYAGIKQLEIARNFFNSYTVHNSKRAQALLDSRHKTLDEALLAAQERNNGGYPDSKADTTQLTLQKWTLGIGLLLIAGTIVILAVLRG